MNIEIAKVNWEGVRRRDGSYDLGLVAQHTGCKITHEMNVYLALVERIKPIESRQAAAIAVATALALYSRGGDHGDG